MPGFFSTLARGAHAAYEAAGVACSSAATWTVGAAKAIWEGTTQFAHKTWNRKKTIVKWTFSLNKMAASFFNILTSTPPLFKKYFQLSIETPWRHPLTLSLSIISAAAAFICTHFLYSDFLEDDPDQANGEIADVENDSGHTSQETPAEVSAPSAWRKAASKILQSLATLCVIISKTSESAILWDMMGDVMQILGIAGSFPLLPFFCAELTIALFGKIFLNLYKATDHIAKAVEANPQAVSILKKLVALFNATPGLRNTTTSIALSVRTFGEDCGPLWGIPLGIMGQAALEAEDPTLKLATIITMACTGGTTTSVGTNNFYFDRREMAKAIQEAGGETPTEIDPSRKPGCVTNTLLGLVGASPFILGPSEASGALFATTGILPRPESIALSSWVLVNSMAFYALTEASEGIDMIRDSIRIDEVNDEESLLDSEAPTVGYGAIINS